jgi:hypothetical protein
MKSLRKLCTAYVLILALACSALAGDISTPLAPPQPAQTPAPAEGEMSTTFYGDMHTTNTDEVTAGDAVVAGALSLVQGVLSLL